MADTLTGVCYDVTNSLANALAASASQTITIVGFTLANTDSSAHTVDVFVNRTTGDDSYIMKDYSIPANDTFAWDGKIILNNSDALQALADANSVVDMDIAYLVQT